MSIAAATITPVVLDSTFVAKTTSTVTPPPGVWFMLGGFPPPSKEGS